MNAETQSQSGGEIIEQYTTGEEVLFRGDFLPNRIWKVKDVGVRFITITTDNIEGLHDKDTIKVVSPMDIYRAGDFGYNVNNNEMPSHSMPPMPPMPPMQSIHGGQHDGTPAINFAPVFKIMNGGNDFSSGEPTNESNNITHNSSSITKPQEMNTITDLAIASNPLISSTKPSNEKIGMIPDKQEAVDFSKLIIKKV